MPTTYRRDRLPAGASVAGPAVIFQKDFDHCAAARQRRDCRCQR
ncbi:MAG: hypothetical protein U0Z44_17875 [Kouleothrix sp.]